MRTYNLEAAPTAFAIELKIDKRPKAKRILLGIDVHLRGYQAARKIDDGVIGVVDTFRSEVELLLHIEKQRHRGGLVWLSAPGKGDEIRNPVALQGEVVPSDLFGLAMSGDEGPLERAEEIGLGPFTRDAGRKVLARAGASEAD